MSPRRRFRTLPLSASGYFQASSLARRLAGTSGRIEFVILRTGHSPPVALHPVSRRMRLRSVTGRRVRAWRGLSPLSSCTLASARAPASLPALGSASGSPSPVKKAGTIPALRGAPASLPDLRQATVLLTVRIVNSCRDFGLKSRLQISGPTPFLLSPSERRHVKRGVALSALKIGGRHYPGRRFALP